jgi:hypothetical protein
VSPNVAIGSRRKPCQLWSLRTSPLTWAPGSSSFFRADRKDLPHLTLSWNNRSGEVDIHLTFSLGTGGTGRESIARFPQAELKRLAESLGSELLGIVATSTFEVVWSVSPSWLMKRNFRLLGPKAESVVQWLHQSAPKIRGKHRLDSEKLRNIPKYALYSPTRQRLAQLAQFGMMYSVCTKGPERGRVLILLPVALFGPVWSAMDYDDLQRFAETVQRLFRKHWQRLATKQAKRVYAALRLREIGW